MRAVSYDLVPEDSRPRCMICMHGRMNPYHFSMSAGGYEGIDYLTGWIIRCDWDQCKFTVPMTPHKRQVL